MFSCIRVAISLLTALIPLGAAYAAENPFVDVPLYPAVNSWTDVTDPFNGERRLRGHVDESDGLKISLQWYCPRNTNRLHLGIDVEGRKLDVIPIGSKRVLWLRKKIDQRDPENGYIEAEDDYRFTIPSSFDELANDKNNHVVFVGFSVSGRERIFQVGVDSAVEEILASGCPKTKEYDPAADTPRPPPEGLRPPAQMR